MKPNILVIGAGAIGGFYGALLAKAGADVAVVCRSDYEYVKQHGFRISSATLGDWNFIPSQILRQASDYEKTADYVLLCSKVIPSLDRAELLRPAVKKDTVIVFIQNGVNIEQELQDAFPGHDIISGLAFVCCNRSKPGEIVHLAYGRLVLGNLPVGIGNSAELLCRLFNQSGIECNASADIITERWKKCVWNAPFNPLSVLSGGLLTQDLLHAQEPLVRGIMQEIYDIAAACGHRLAADIIQQNIDNTYAMPPYKTSMLLDYEHRQPMETEAILGNAVRAAKHAGIDCPRLETIYALLKLTELKFGLS